MTSRFKNFKVSGHAGALLFSEKNPLRFARPPIFSLRYEQGDRMRAMTFHFSFLTPIFFVRRCPKSLAACHLYLVFNYNRLIINNLPPPIFMEEGNACALSAGKGRESF